MAEYAIALLTDRKRYADFREACLHRARTQFCDGKISSQYEQIYYRVLGIRSEVPVTVCEA